MGLRSFVRSGRGRGIYLPVWFLVMLFSLSVAAAGCAPSPKERTKEPTEAPGESGGKAGLIVRFKSADGIPLEGRMFGKGKLGVVLAHMFPADQTSWQPFARRLAEKGYLALTFDFRGYGASGGDKEIAKIDLDLESAVAKLKDEGAGRIAVIGASMGATAALKLAARQKLDQVIALSPAATFRGLSAEKEIASVAEPKLFLASEQDIARQSTEALFKRSPDPKEIRILPGSAHGSDLLLGEEGGAVERAILDFLEQP